MGGPGSQGIFTMVVKMLVCLVLWNALVAHEDVGGSDRMAIAPHTLMMHGDDSDTDNETRGDEDHAELEAAK